VSRIESVLFSAFVQRRRSASAVRTTLHQKGHGKISKKGTLGDDGRHNDDGAEDGYSQLTTAPGRERREWKRREPLAALSRSHRSTVRHSCEPRAGDIDFPATSLVRIALFMEMMYLRSWSRRRMRRRSSTARQSAVFQDVRHSASPMPRQNDCSRLSFGTLCGAGWRCGERGTAQSRVKGEP
jgi:hypothetical protein